MKYKISSKSHWVEAIKLPYSKSISNRLIIMQALSKDGFKIKNLSDADDTKLLVAALKSDAKEIDAGMAGTTFRFLTSYFAAIQKEVVLTGHRRMKQRPIVDLVSALKRLGADILFTERANYPPIQIQRGKLEGGFVQMASDTSSQFITAMLLVAPYLKLGLEIHIEGEVVSRPYIEMTFQLMKKMGIDITWNSDFKGERIAVKQGNYQSNRSVDVEADWSAAAFFYQYFACSNLTELKIVGLQQNSIQGDAKTAVVFEKLGVKTTYTNQGVTLSKKEILVNSIEMDLTDTPDLIPSFAIASSLLLEEVKITGVQTLRFKECNRVEALITELEKVGIKVLDLNSKQIVLRKFKIAPDSICFEVYNDHRMAMAFAALSSSIKEVVIENPEVVSKSFPRFWEEFGKFTSIRTDYS